MHQINMYTLNLYKFYFKYVSKKGKHSHYSLIQLNKISADFFFHSQYFVLSPSNEYVRTGKVMHAVFFWEHLFFKH